jgi:biopolymer transport protein TolR
VSSPHKGGSLRATLRADTNVTPLVDVCMVLLIIFMVVTPLANGEVKLPQASWPEAWPVEPARSRITVEYGEPPRISLDDDPGPLSAPALEALLRAIHAGHPGREIVLRADRRLPYAEVKKVIQAVQDAGFRAIGLVAERSR